MAAVIANKDRNAREQLNSGRFTIMDKQNIYETWLVKQPIAHRGLHNEEFPENSMGAFENAIRHGYAIETDVHLTTDKVVVIFHDDTLKRMTGVRGNIDEMSYEELKKLTLLGGNNERIPKLSDLLELTQGKVPLLIEVKTHKNIGELEALMTDMLRKYKGEFAVQSFNPFIVRWFKDNAPEFIRGQLSSYFTTEFGKGFKAHMKCVILRNCMFNRYCGAQFTSYDTSFVDKKRVRKIKKKMPVLMWTVRSQAHLDKCKGLYDNIIFEGFIPKV